MQLFGLRQLICLDFRDLDFKVPPPRLAKASRWQDQPRASLPWAPWAFPKCKTERFCFHSCSTASERGETTPSGSRIQSHLPPKQLRPTRARERALNLQASRCAPHLLFAEGADPVTHPMDTQTPRPELPTGVAGSQPPFSQQIKSLGDKSLQKKKPQLEQTNTNPRHPWSSKADPWSNNQATDHSFSCSKEVRSSLWFPKEILPFKKTNKKKKNQNNSQNQLEELRSF